jgi:hypothetical protein
LSKLSTASERPTTTAAARSREAWSSEYAEQAIGEEAAGEYPDGASDRRCAKDDFSHMRLAISTKIHTATANAAGQ